MSKLKIYKRLPKSDSERVVRKIRNLRKNHSANRNRKKEPKGYTLLKEVKHTSRRERIAIFKKL
jgi:hypothetical protein